MSSGRSLFTVVCGAVHLALCGLPALAETNCKEPATGTSNVPIFSSPLANVVTGTGRLQFYSAPNGPCDDDSRR